MITSKKIQEYADGKVSGQDVVVIVQADGSIIPAVVLNCYLNLNMRFLTMQQIMMKASNVVSMAGKEQVIQAIMYFFVTSVKNYEKYFGPYRPNKILPFELIPEREPNG